MPAQQFRCEDSVIPVGMQPARMPSNVAPSHWRVLIVGTMLDATSTRSCVRRAARLSVRGAPLSIGAWRESVRKLKGFLLIILIVAPANQRKYLKNQE